MDVYRVGDDVDSLGLDDLDEVVIRSDSGVAISMTKYVRRDEVAGDDDWTISKAEV